MAPIKRRQRPAAIPVILWPRDVQAMLGISCVTRWRMERDGRLPARDAYVGGEPIGWLKTTIDAAIRGAHTTAQAA